MEKQILNRQQLETFASYLRDEEKSMATIEKYMHDIRYFMTFIGDQNITKQAIKEYKDFLSHRYAATSVNSMLAALNCFLRFCGWHTFCVKQLKIQREAYCSAEKELTKTEYIRLLTAAKTKRKERLYLIIQTICSTGIRVSELQYITVEAIQKGETVVNGKGKNRRSFIVSALKKN